MTDKLYDPDTICAIATPAGGAIGIVRISGSKSFDIVNRLFQRDITKAAPNTLHHGDFLSLEGEVIDDVVVSLYRAPHSYTGEDAIEISCHGSAYILHQINVTLIQAGCRQAGPGEFTRRAYLNGKLDLSQAEAVADIISASSKAAHDIAISQLKGYFSKQLSALRDDLLKMNSLLELELDFSDHEELEFADRTELYQLASKIKQQIEKLAGSFKSGEAIKKGIPVAIVGKTNVGKSTLLNQLLHEDKAIVTNIHGTTRDVIEDTTEIHGITYRFIDTAGIRATDDEVEKQGIIRTYQKIDEAQLVLWIIDAEPAKDEYDDMCRRTADKTLLIVHNKSDLGAMPQVFDTPVIEISAKYGKGIQALTEEIYHASQLPEVTQESVLVTSSRHYDALCRANESITRVITGMDSQLSNDLLSEDLRICLDDLADITGGAITPQETLNNIFAHFCIGK